MSEDREVIEPATGATMSLSQAIKSDPEEYKRLRAERKARFSRVLERGVVADRLFVDLPPDLWGEWVPRDKQSIIEKEMLGFRVDTEFAKKRALHDGGDGASYVGDCVYMIQDVEDHNLLEEIRRENFEAANGKPGAANTVRQGEEKEFSGQTRTLGLPVVEESKAKTARKEELQAALKAAQAGNVQAPASTRIIK